MRNQDLNRFINCYNNKKWKELANFQRIANNVVLGHIWRDPPRLSYQDEKDTFFFIENELGRSVGIVFLMGSFDIHWYVKREFRRKGFLSNSLHNTIFPFIFSDGRPEQYSSYDSERNKEYLARQGFVPTDESGRMVLKKDSVKELKAISFARPNEDEIKIQQRNMWKVAREIDCVVDNLFLKTGEDFGLSEMVENFKGFILDLEIEIEKHFDKK